MSGITDVQADLLKEIVLNYLQGENIALINVRLDIQCNELNRRGRDLYKSIDLKKDDCFIVAILGSLAIKKGKSEATNSYYKTLFNNSANLHALLINLYDDGHHHVGYLLQLIENSRPRRSKLRSFITGITSLLSSLGLGGLVYFKSEYFRGVMPWLEKNAPVLAAWFSQTFSLLRNIPLLGITYTGLGLGWSWHNTLTRGTTTTSHQVFSLFFKSLTAGLTITAYTLCYLAGGVMTTPVACLFVCSTAVDVFKNLLMITNQRPSKTGHSSVTKNDGWEVMAEYERTNNLYGRSAQTVRMKLIAASLTTATVIIWCFYPPNVLISLSCMAFMALTTLVKNALIANIHELYAHKLQQGIQVLANAKLRPSMNPALVNLSKQEHKLKLETLQLQEKSQYLEAWEKTLTWQEQAITRVLNSINSSSAKALLGLLQGGPHFPNGVVYEHKPNSSHSSPEVTDRQLIMRGNLKTDPEEEDKTGDLVSFSP